MSKVPEAIPLPINREVLDAALLERVLSELDRCRRDRSRALSFVEQLLITEKSSASLDDKSLAARLFLEIIRDLLRQGWCFNAPEGILVASPPEVATGGAIDGIEIKERLRASLIAARNEQLREPAIRQFIRAMERPRRHRGK